MGGLCGWPVSKSNMCLTHARGMGWREEIQREADIGRVMKSQKMVGGGDGGGEGGLWEAGGWGRMFL